MHVNNISIIGVYTGSAGPTSRPTISDAVVAATSNFDVDIADLLRSEINKDKVPDDFRASFSGFPLWKMGQTATRRSDSFLPSRSVHGNFLSKSGIHQSFHSASLSHSPFLNDALGSPFSGSFGQTQSSGMVTKFHAPVPITPTMMSVGLKSRYKSPVPRYVVELAKKLKREGNIQGIVRVSTRRGDGPPIEYLYPVRGK